MRQVGIDLPFEGGKGGIGADESDRNEKAPGWVEVCVAIQKFQGEPDDETCCDIDEQCTEGKARAHPAGYGGSHPEAGNGTQGSSDGDE